MPITAILGEQRGDEGKGRFADMLATDHDIVARFNGGSNAGHTVVTPEGLELALHLIPSGIAQPHTMNVIGNGTVIDPVKLVAEINYLKQQGIEINPNRLMISSAAHLVLPTYVSDDEIREAGTNAQGTTKSGIAQTYAAKSLRHGFRAEIIKNNPEALRQEIERSLTETADARKQHNLESIDPKAVSETYIQNALQLVDFITDTTLYLNRELTKNKPARVLAEGAQAFLLDIDHGMYPAVTSSSTTTGGILTGLGVPANHIKRIIGVSKAVQSHVGGGPFATEINDPELLAQLHGDMGTIDAEKGTTTGRVRRLGHLDLPAIRRAQMVNGSTEMALTKLDWVPRYGKTISVCTSYTRKEKKLPIAPDAAYKIEGSTPNYEQLPTWSQDVSEIRTFDELPNEAKRYIEFIEEHTGVPISMIGVGPRRDQVIVRDSRS